MSYFYQVDSILDFIAWQVENRLLERKFVSLEMACNMREAFYAHKPYSYPPRTREKKTETDAPMDDAQTNSD